MPISQNTYTVPNNFVQQYDLGQHKIRADLVDENFTDAAGAINTLLTDVANTVHLTGAETISGAKTFSGNNTFSGSNSFGANTTGVTATAGDNSTKYATTAYADNAASTAAAGVAVSPSSSTPAARSSSGSVGTSTAYARADHSHPNNWGSTTVSATAPAVVVETWHSGTEWYRVWSDGWIEQGGEIPTSRTSLTFQKPFTAKPLSVSVLEETSGSSTYSYGAVPTSTGMTFANFSTNKRLWYTCGF